MKTTTSWSRSVCALGLLLIGGLMLTLTGCSGDKTMDKEKTDKVSSERSDRRYSSLKPPMELKPPTEVKPPSDKTPSIVNAPVPLAMPVPPAAEPPGAEQYRHNVDNPFHKTAAAPLSTLSIDVDTASYSNVRRFLLSEGRLPPRDAVRIEELINYFSYNYPQPVGDSPVSLTAELTRCPWNDKHLLARVALRGRTIPKQQMPPRNYVFLLDTSGSMTPENRLPLLKKSLRLLVDELRPEDRVAMVAYAGSAGLVLPATRGTEKQTILAAIDRLQSGGSTNGGAGIELAYRVAQENLLKPGVNRVILGTDGDFNVGTTSEGELVRLIEEKRKSGIYLSILGFGMGNLKDGTMEQLAHHGNGHYAYIDSLDEAQKLFVEEGGALFTIANDVKLQVEFNPKRVGGYRLVGYENRLLKDQDFNDDKKDAGDMGSGHTVTVLYEIVPAGEAVPAPGVDPLKYQGDRPATQAATTGEWLTVKMRYKDPDAEQSKLLAQPLMGEPIAFENTPEDFRFATSVAMFGLVLRDSPYKGTGSLERAATIAGKALGSDPKGRRAEFLSLVQKAKGLK